MRKILIGLGNPGAQYENTYHNAGALAVTKIMDDLLPEANAIKEKGSPLFSSTEIKLSDGETYIFIRPKTFMNESGLAIKAVLKYFSAKPGEIIIFHDDSDLLLGTVKVSNSGNLAGHHGLISVRNETEISNFTRVRIGIRNPDEKTRKKAEEFVLKNIPKTKLTILLGKEFIEGWLALRKKS